MTAGTGEGLREQHVGADCVVAACIELVFLTAGPGGPGPRVLLGRMGRGRGVRSRIECGQSLVGQKCPALVGWKIRTALSWTATAGIRLSSRHEGGALVFSETFQLGPVG